MPSKADTKKNSVNVEPEEVETKQEPVNTELVPTDSSVPSTDEYGALDLGELGFTEDELEGLTGLDKVNASDIRVPFAKLHSKPSKGIEVGDVQLVNGDIIKGLNGETIEEFCILNYQPVRVFFPTKFSKDNTFICRSFDAIEGAEDGKYAGVKCATCEFSKYPEDGGASPCREQILLLCTTNDGVMFHLLVSGIGVREFRKGFMSVEMMPGLRKVKQITKLKHPPICALNLTLSVVTEDTDFGPFPKLIFKVNQEKPVVSANRIKENLGLFASYKTFEREAVASAATFAQTEQGEHDPEPEEQGENSQLF